jgi:hypothetical protein
MRITVAIDQDVFEALERAAKAESRSLSRQAGVLLRGAFAKTTLPPTKPAPRRRRRMAANTSK